ncbi:MAG: TatD family hydrolase [Desulfurococcaceae archaeon]
MLVDMHIHCAEMRDSIADYVDKYTLICVSDDPESSVLTIELGIKHGNVNPCIGIHPWNIHEYTLRDVELLVKNIVENTNVKCIGEVGLDKIFRPDTIDKQLSAFQLFVRYAKEYDLVLNLHAAGAWHDVYKVIYSSDIKKAYFHWYTGSKDLLKDIVQAGYFIGANPAWIIQNKHRDIIVNVDLKYLLTESDAPYNYRGMYMRPELIEKTIELLSEIHGMSKDVVVEIVMNNYKKLFK